MTKYYSVVVVFYDTVTSAIRLSRRETSDFFTRSSAGRSGRILWRRRQASGVVGSSERRRARSRSTRSALPLPSEVRPTPAEVARSGPVPDGAHARFPRFLPAMLRRRRPRQRRQSPVSAKRPRGRRTAPQTAILILAHGAAAGRLGPFPGAPAFRRYLVFARFARAPARRRRSQGATSIAKMRIAALQTRSLTPGATR